MRGTSVKHPDSTTVSIPASQAGGRGSIPRLDIFAAGGLLSSSANKLVVFLKIVYSRPK